MPGGFGIRGIEGMIAAADYARRNNIPYFGICLGMQIAAIAFDRGALGYEDANSTEFAPDSKHPVIALMEEQMDLADMGGTMSGCISVPHQSGYADDESLWKKSDRRETSPSL